MRLANRRELRARTEPRISTPTKRVGLVELHESYDVAGGRIAIVARLGSAWFVLLGDKGGDYSDFDVSIGYDTHEEALERAELVGSRV